MKSSLLWSLGLLASITMNVMAQDKPNPPTNLKATVTLTPDEKVAVSRAEVKVLQDQQQRAAAIAQMDKQMTADQQKLQAAITAIYDSRKLKQDDWTLCETKDTQLCKDAPENDLTLQPKPIPPTEKEKK
jgi:outer membrane translocation and assembly module TamA